MICMYSVIHISGGGKSQVTVEQDFWVICMYSVIHIMGVGKWQVSVEKGC